MPFAFFSLFKNWKAILIILAIIAVLGTVGFLTWKYTSTMNENEKLKTEAQALEDIIEDKNDIILTCENDKTLTFEASNEYQKSLADLRRNYNALRVRTSNPKCKPIITDQTR